MRNAESANLSGDFVTPRSVILLETTWWKFRRHKFLACFFVMIGVIRVTSTYRHTSQLFDEPCHVAASIELLDHHTYKLDPVHPPLARIAIGIPLYLADERYPKMSAAEAATADYNVVGNHILYDSGHYVRNLTLARIAMLPFFLMLSYLVYLWGRREFGNTAGLVGVAFLTTTPIVLALASVAYTDLVTAATQFAAFFAFTYWLRQPSKRSTWLLGAALGFALMSKLTSLIFLPAGAAAIVACQWFGRNSAGSPATVGLQWKKLLGAVAIGTILLWGSYGFSTGHIREEFNLSLTAMPSFQHFPAPAARFARSMVVNDWRIPAPAFFHGFAEAWVLSKTAAPTYMFGALRKNCWYFFPVGVFFKSPLPLLILCGLGLLFMVRRHRELSWSAWAPAAAAGAIFLITLPVKYHAGMRHVLVLFPLFAMLGGSGATYLWTAGRARRFAQAALIALLVWQGCETLRAQSDFIAYFNEFAGTDPSRVLVTGCDLDCGQDVFRLAQNLKARNVNSFNLAVWSSADMERMGLPQFGVLQPFRPVDGWVAVSARSIRLGEVLHETYPLGSLSWLEKYTPVAEVGHTISLYYIPPGSKATLSLPLGR